MFLELGPLLEMWFQLTDIRAIRECNEATSLKISQLSRATDIIGVQASAVLEFIQFLTTNQSCSSCKLSIGEEVAREGPQVGGNPLPIKVRKIINTSVCE